MFSNIMVIGLILLLSYLALTIKRSWWVKFVYIKDLWLPLTSILFIAGLILFSKTAVTSAAKGLQLWLHVVFPSLFPFFVGSEILNRTGISKTLGVFLEPLMRPLFNVPGCGCLALALGITSGYPMGAKMTVDLRKNQLISKAEGERLLAFTNNSGPLFIAGAVSVGMFKLPALGLFLLACHITAGITVGILFRFYKIKDKEKKVKNKNRLVSRFLSELSSVRNPSEKINLGSMLGDAVTSSVSLMLAIGGFIILFSVIIHLLLEIGLIGLLAKFLMLVLSPLHIGHGLAAALASGFFEITTGTSMASTAANSTLIQQITAASMIIGWAGLSVHSQVYSIVSKTDLSMKPYLIGKLLQGVFSAAYTFIAIKITGFSLIGSKPVFLQTPGTKSPDFFGSFLNACNNFIFAFGFLVACLLLAAMVKRKSKLKEHATHKY